MDRREIVEVKTYVDGEGREVREFVQVFGKDKQPNVYMGRRPVQMQPIASNGMPMPPQMLPFEFMFPEKMTLKKAFETFDEVFKEKVEEQNKRAKEHAAANRVVAARAMPPLLGADGKPLKAGG